jgi:hypothetical protein
MTPPSLQGQVQELLVVFWAFNAAARMSRTEVFTLDDRIERRDFESL